MLHRIFGQVGSGKKERLLGAVSAAYEAGKRILVLVPEQATAGYERDVVSLLGNRAGERVEVTNFSRLPDLVLRAFGGLGEVSLGDTEKKILFFSCKIGKTILVYNVCISQ